MTTTASMRAEYSTSTATTASSSAASDPASARRGPCLFCENVKQLRDVLPGKKCDYCYQTKCQFCTLKFPLLNVRKGLPKALKSNSRICVTCFTDHWPGKDAAIKGSSNARLERKLSVLSSERQIRRRDSEWQETELVGGGRESFDEATLASTRESVVTSTRVVVTEELQPSVFKRLASALGLVAASKDGSLIQRDLIHVVELWISLFTAAILLAVVLIQDLALSYRLVVCTAIYGLFLALHPWVHNTTVTVNASSSSEAKRIQQDVAAPAVSLSLPRAPSARVPDVYRATFVEMQAAFNDAVSDPSKWKVVRSVSGGKVYEVATSKPHTLFMLDTFVSGITIAEFISFMNRTDVKDRAVWDQNIAAFEVVESFPDDNASIIYNAQKPFLGGLLSARDFCLLYTSTASSIIYASVTHPRVPEKPHATRAVVHLAGYHCQEATNAQGESGFQLKYIVQVDIRSSIPSRMVYNGTADNLERMIKTFGQAKKLFGKAAAA